MSRECSIHGKVRNAYKIVFMKLDGKRPIGTSRHRWKNNIKIDHKEIGYYEL
jgi:hypothetical protein